MNRGQLVVPATIWAVAVVVLVVIAIIDNTLVAHSYLAAWLVMISLPLGALSAVMGMELLGQGDTAPTRSLRLLLASLPLLSLLVVPVLLDLRGLYPWSPNSTVATSVASHFEGLGTRWFTSGFFVVRSLIYLVAWNVLALFFIRPARRRALAAFGLAAHAVIGTLAAFDWFMSLDQAYVSSTYGVVVLTTQCAFALTVALLMSLALERRAPPHRPAVLALLIVAAFAVYAQFAEYLVVWSANLPKEIAWYQTRWQGVIGPIFVWLVPCLLLLALAILLPPPFGTRRIPALVALGGLLVVELADLVLLASPRGTFTIGLVLLDLVFVVAMLGLAAMCAYAIGDRRTMETKHG